MTCLWAQREVKSDTLRRTPPPAVIDMGGFLIDMTLADPTIVPVTAKPSWLFPVRQTKDYNRIFGLNPDVTYTQGSSRVFHAAPLYGGGGFSSTSTHLQMGSFRLKNGMQLNTYGNYNAEGWRMPDRSALPWDRNRFRGAFELKSGNGAFGIRVEVQQGRTTPF